MNFSNNVPTVFAQSLAEMAEITVSPQVGRNHLEYTEKLARLKAFQQMAVAVSYEECLIAFHGQELTDEQKDVLKVIYKSTKPWMLGHVVGVLLDKLDGKNMANKDFAESVRTIVEQLTKDDESNTPTEKMKGLMITLTEKAS